MLTLQQPDSIAERHLPVAERRAADNANGPDTPMACESFLADAMCHLLSGFLIVEDVDASSRSQSGSVIPLHFISENIRAALKELDNCSVEFWRFTKARMAAGPRFRELRDPYRRRRASTQGNCGRDAPALHGVETRLGKHLVPEVVMQMATGTSDREIRPARESNPQTACASITKSECEESLASAILHLVGAYRAMEVLSASALPSGAPESFELACRCLCTSLVYLDAYLATSVD
jgi:hypothetical protein